MPVVAEEFLARTHLSEQRILSSLAQDPVSTFFNLFVGTYAEFNTLHEKLKFTGSSVQNQRLLEKEENTI